MRTFRHFSWADRLQLEAYLKAGKKPCEIALLLNKDLSSVYREMHRGQYVHLNKDYTTEKRYSPDIAHKKYRQHLAAKGAELKIGSDIQLAQYIENKIINENYSPAAVLGELRTSEDINFSTSICVSTLYSYIDKGVFLNLTNKHLPVKSKRKRSYKKIRQQIRASRGESIEKRPPEINSRTDFGHWEMDTVIGKRKKTMLVLTERLTRQEKLILLPDKKAESVVNALNALERRCGSALFKKLFASITVDNGVEFSDCAGMEKSCRTKGKRTKIYYCHPYSSWERGSNENQNKMIRRKYPKGSDFDKLTQKDVKNTEEWINNYPRKIFGYRCSAAEFEKQLSML